MSILSALKKSAPVSVLPPTVTTHDVLKSFALLLMIADHIGYYFFPEDFWWRVFGRLCVPIWLFLIGYARSRTIDRQILGGALLLTAVNAALGISFLPVNILWTIILLRLAIDPLMAFIRHSIDRLFLVTLAALVLFPFSNALTEYGTLGLILCISGHIFRNGFGNDRRLPFLYGAAVAVLFAGTQIAQFPFDPFQVMTLCVGTGLVMTALLLYLPKAVTAIDSPVAVPILHALGRHTLLIYVAHLILFKLIYFHLCPCMRNCCCHPLPIDFTQMMR